MIRKLLNGIALRYSLSDLFKLVRVLIFKRKILIPLGLNSVKIRCLSLDGRLDRREQLEQNFKHNIDSYMFKAYSPQELEIRLLPKTFISSNSLKYLTESSISCIISHLNCWLELLDDSVDSYLILEDDVVPIKSLDIILDNYHLLPIDFDIIILGNVLKKSIHIDTQTSNGFFIPWVCRRGFYSYLISKKGVEKLLKKILPIDITCGGIDTIVGREIRKQEIQAYRTEQDFFGHNKKSPSDILNPDQSQKIMNKNNLTKLPYELRVKNNTRFLDKIYPFIEHDFNLSRIY